MMLKAHKTVISDLENALLGSATRFDASDVHADAGCSSDIHCHNN
jgi:hypothetical protein